jgi:hypothetical protein
MTTRPFITALLAFFGVGKTAAEKAKTAFPPVPAWRPTFTQPRDRVIDRIAYYTNGTRDFTVLKNGTCVILQPGLSDAEAKKFSLKVLSDILNYHPDMNPAPMDDGNILVSYNHPAVNVVIREVAEAHWAEIEARHLDGLATSEVLFTPLGSNKFDAFGKQALLGRAYMFMDAQTPEIVEIKRHLQRR